MARVKRPKLDRDGPVRNWAAAMGSEPETAARDASEKGAEPPLDSGDPVFRGVVAGGQVVDQWIRQAQQTARLLGGPPSAVAWADATGQMMKAASDVMTTWWALLGATRPGNGPPGDSRTGPARHESAWQAAAPPREAARGDAGSRSTASAGGHQPSTGPRVRLELASRRPVEVTVSLNRTGVKRFRVLDLRPEHGDAPRIQGTELDPWDADGVRLRLAVPDEQTAGTYHAVILDADADCVAGTVTLRIPAQ